MWTVDFNLMEPITHENVSDLTPGEWIWDNDMIHRDVHEKTIFSEKIPERVGFRQVHILDLELYPRWSSKPFMLTSVDNRSGREWVYFENGRFFRFKRGEEYEKT